MSVISRMRPIKLGFCIDESGELTGTLEAYFCADFLSRRPFGFDKGLAMAAAGLSFSFASEELLRSDLEALGFRDIRIYGGGDGDCTGLCLASKRLADTTFVVAVLGGTRGEEWLSNFEVGYSAQHLGFSQAADCAEQRVCEYLMERGLRGELGFLVTGYSRGGAVADILGKRLCDRFGSDSVRGYTFAAPNTTRPFRGASYGGLFNIVRDEDLFTRLPLESWGYTRFGGTIRMSGEVSRGYRNISGRDYIGFADDTAVQKAVDGLYRLAPDVHAYYERRYPVGSGELSLHEYMLKIAAFLAGKEDSDIAVTLLDGAASAYGGFIDFMSEGADIGELMLSSGGAPRCSVADAHSPAAYVAAMKQALS